MYKMIMSGAVDHGAAHLSVVSSLIWSEKQSAALYLWSNTHWQTNKPKHIKPQHNRSLRSSCPTSECPEWWEKSVSFLVLWASNTKCSWTQSPTRSGKWLQSAVHVIQASSTRCLRAPSPQSTSGFKKKKIISFLFSFISGNMGRSPTPWGREWRKCQCWSERTGGISVSWWLPHWSEEGTWAGMAPPLRHHARKPSPLQTSRWSSGCPGSWANIGPKVLKAPNTPAVRGRGEKKIKKLSIAPPPKKRADISAASVLAEERTTTDLVGCHS